MGGSIKDAFNAYEKLRRGRINAAYEENRGVVRSVKDVGWLGFTIKRLAIPIFLRWSSKSREKHFEEDVTTSPLGFGDEVEEAQAGVLQGFSSWQTCIKAVRNSWLVLTILHYVEVIRKGA